MNKNWNKIKHIRLNKYVITLIIFGVIILFFDKYNLIDRWKNKRQINKLEKEIDYYKKEIENNRLKMKEMQSGDEILEKYGREKFYLKKDGEDIYIIEEEDNE